MTDQDQNAAIGELTKRYSDGKRKRSALVADIVKRKEAIDKISRDLYVLQSRNIIGSSDVPQGHFEYSDAATMNGLLRDLLETCRDIERTQALLKNAGVDVN